MTTFNELRNFLPDRDGLRTFTEREFCDLNHSVLLQLLIESEGGFIVRARLNRIYKDGQSMIVVCVSCFVLCSFSFLCICILLCV